MGCALELVHCSEFQYAHSTPTLVKAMFEVRVRHFEYLWGTKNLIAQICEKHHRHLVVWSRMAAKMMVV